MELYLNHSLLDAANARTVSTLLKELVQLDACARTEGCDLRFYQYLWDVRLSDGRTLREFLFHLPYTNELKLIMGYVDDGPHFQDQPFVQGLQITPHVQNGTFGEKIMHLCFREGNQFVVSLQQEQILQHSMYQLSTSSNTIDVRHLRGEQEVCTHFRRSLRFSRIDEVFKEAVQRAGNIRIHREAERSARRFNFSGRFEEVFQALIALETVELKSVQENANEEQRIQLFREATGLEISKETSVTLQDPLFRKQRSFSVPGYMEQQLFEWHVKIGQDLRIHYFVDKKNWLVYVGHCGAHCGIRSRKS